jgi:hypothetical protein
MIAAKPIASARAATAVILVTGAILSLAVNYPGHLEFDGIMQLAEGESGIYSNWHPPVMSWLLGLSAALRGDAWLFVLLDTALGTGAFLFLLGSARIPTKATVLIALVIVALPQLLLFPSIVWKDILFANATIAGFCCLSLATEARAKFLLPVAIILLALAVLARQNGIVILPCAALAYGMAAGKRDHSILRRSALAGLAIFALAFAGHRLLQLRASGELGPARQFEYLQIYDIAGMLQAQPALKLGALDARAPAMAHFLRNEGPKLYTPALQDPVAFDPRLRPLIFPSLGAVGAQWRELVAAHPLLYLRVRAEEFSWLFLQQHPDKCLTYTIGVFGPEKQMKMVGMSQRHDRRDEWLEDNYAEPLVGTPALSHVVFALAGLVCLIVLLMRREASDWPMAAMLVASALYVLSYFFIGVACQYRYLFVMDMTALVAMFYLSFRRSAN